MVEWTGLLSVLAFVLTVGIPIPVTLATSGSYRAGITTFTRALWINLLQAGVFYLLGVYVLWTIGAGVSRVVTLLVVGAVASVTLVALPLVIGRRIVGYATDTNSETALRTATYCWPPAMICLFGLFVLPDGASRVTFFHLGGSESCLLGFCGVSVLSVAAVLLGGVVAFFGPGVLGVVYLLTRK